MIKDSPNARAVAREVIAKTLKGEPVRKGAIAVKHGYAKSIGLHPSKVTQTQSYIDEVSKTVRILEVERDRAIERLQTKIDSAPYNHLIDGVDKLIKNIQLLSGRSTENKAIHIEISEVIARKNQLVT